jgi:quinol monooxygenase YgiN
MRVLSYLRMEIDPDQTDAYEEDLEEMIRMARKTPGFLGVEVFRAHGEPKVYLVLSEWESHEAMRSFLMLPRHVEIIRWYKRGYARASSVAATPVCTGCATSSWNRTMYRRNRQIRISLRLARVESKHAHMGS